MIFSLIVFHLNAFVSVDECENEELKNSYAICCPMNTTFHSGDLDVKFLPF